MSEPETTAPGRRIQYRLLRPLSAEQLEWARKQARWAHLSLATWLRRVGETQRGSADRTLQKAPTRPSERPRTPRE